MSSELRVDKIIPTAGVPTGGAGGVIQVVGTMNTTQVEPQPLLHWVIPQTLECQ